MHHPKDFAVLQSAQRKSDLTEESLFRCFDSNTAVGQLKPTSLSTNWNSGGLKMQEYHFFRFFPRLFGSAKSLRENSQTISL